MSGKVGGGGSPVTLAADGDVELEPRTTSARGEM
jgi:hypothetical protein